MNGRGGSNMGGPVQIVGEMGTGQSTGADDEECGIWRPKMEIAKTLIKSQSKGLQLMVYCLEAAKYMLPEQRNADYKTKKKLHAVS